MLNDFYQIAFRRKIYRSIEELQVDLADWLVYYNNDRRTSGSLLKAEIEVDSVSTQKDVHQGSQLGRRGLGEAGAPAAREPLQRRQPCSH